ncbi:hypothetical protein Tco_0084555 [Tanacetum coccineum]
MPYYLFRIQETKQCSMCHNVETFLQQGGSKRPHHGIQYSKPATRSRRYKPCRITEKSLRRLRGTVGGRFYVHAEEVGPSRYDVRVRNVGHVSTCEEETIGLVYDGPGSIRKPRHQIAGPYPLGSMGASDHGLRRAWKLVKSLTDVARNSGHVYDVRRKLGVVTTGRRYNEELESYSQLTPVGHQGGWSQWTMSLRRFARKPSGQVYVVRGNLVKSPTDGEGDPSGQVYVVRGKLVKSLECAETVGGGFTCARKVESKSLTSAARNRRGSRTTSRGTVGEVYVSVREICGQSLRRGEETTGHEEERVAGKEVYKRRGRFTTCEETWSSRYDVRGTVGAGLRRASNLGQVATTCEEPSGQVYVVRGKLVKSLRRARNGRGRFTTCEEPWSSRYDVRGTVGARLRRARKLGQVWYTTGRGTLICSDLAS